MPENYLEVIKLHQNFVMQVGRHQSTNTVDQRYACSIMSARNGREKLLELAWMGENSINLFHLILCSLLTIYCIFRFLFGTCCQLPLTIESPLIDAETKAPNPSSQIVVAYEKFGSQPGTKEQTRPQIVNNQYYGNGDSVEETENEDSNNLYISNNYDVPNEAVMVSSGASPETPTNYHNPPSQSQSYSPELPSLMHTQTSDDSSSVSMVCIFYIVLQCNGNFNLYDFRNRMSSLTTVIFHTIQQKVTSNLRIKSPPMRCIHLQLKR